LGFIEKKNFKNVEIVQFKAPTFICEFLALILDFFPHIFPIFY